MVWVGIALLGGLGAVLRDTIERRSTLLVVNLIGCAVLGAISGVTGDARMLIGTGFLGALTSFSGWALENRRHAVLHLLLALLVTAVARALLGP